DRHLDIDDLCGTAFELGASRGGSEVALSCPHVTLDRPVDRQPARATAQMRGEGAIEIARPRTGDAHENARRAKPTLRTAGADERTGQPCARLVVETFDGRDRAAVDALSGGDARDAWFAVDKNRAAAALALGRATILHRQQPQTLAQDRQQRFGGLDGNVDCRAIARERDPIGHLYLRVGRIGACRFRTTRTWSRGGGSSGPR